MRQLHLNLGLDNDLDQETVKYLQDTQEHIGEVAKNMNELADAIVQRGKVHDQSKLTNPEMGLFIKFGKQLSTLEYGTDEYKEAITTSEAVKHHYAVNTHHPEHYPNGMDDMSLLDILEMLADWKAASIRTKGGTFEKSMEINRKRFNIPDVLWNQMVKTAKELEWL